VARPSYFQRMAGAGGPPRLAPQMPLFRPSPSLDVEFSEQFEASPDSQSREKPGVPRASIHASSAKPLEPGVREEAPSVGHTEQIPAQPSKPPEQAAVASSRIEPPMARTSRIPSQLPSRPDERIQPAGRATPSEGEGKSLVASPTIAARVPDLAPAAPGRRHMPEDDRPPASPARAVLEANSKETPVERTSSTRGLEAPELPEQSRVRLTPARSAESAAPPADSMARAGLRIGTLEVRIMPGADRNEVKAAPVAMGPPVRRVEAGSSAKRAGPLARGFGCFGLVQG
jgi:hypothetical protein